MYLNHEPWFQAPYLRCLRLLCLRSRRKGEDESLSAKRKRKVFKSSSRSQPLEINYDSIICPWLRGVRRRHRIVVVRIWFSFLFISFDATTRTASTHGMFENSTLKRFYGTSHISWNVCTNLGARSLTDDPGREELLDSFPLFLPPFPCMGEAAALRLPDGGLLAERGWDEVGGREPGKTNK